MPGDCILAIDNGTQSVRAMIFDARGNLLAKSRVSLDYPTGGEPGISEVDPEIFWDAVGSACRLLWENPEAKKERLAAVALTTQRSTVINVDRQGKALRPAIIWLDQRRTPGLKPVGGLWGLAFRLSGMSETVAYLQSEAEANWINKYQPEIWKNTHKFLFLSGFLTHKFTGKFIDSTGCQVGYVPFDYKHLRWSSRFDWKWQAVPMPASFLPELVSPAQPLGEITAQAAAHTGIPAGLPLIAAAADKATEIIGAGCLEPEIACLSYGTTATINTTHRKYVELIPLIPPYPSAVPGAYSLEMQVTRGFWMVSWFKREFAESEKRLAEKRGVEPEDLFDDLVNSVPPGSQGLMLQPFWSPGLKVPGPEAKGAVIGFGDIHTRAHFYRSILEGLAYALREGAERTTRRSGVPIKEVRVAGGGSQSHAAMQITADIFGLPASNPHVYEASGLGAAIDAAVGVGLHPNFQAAVEEMTRTAATYEPNPAHHRLYDELYECVYKKMYNRLQPLYYEIRRITGYPPVD